MVGWTRDKHLGDAISAEGGIPGAEDFADREGELEGGYTTALLMFANVDRQKKGFIELADLRHFFPLSTARLVRGEDDLRA
jgi:hypothetical protein